MPLQDRVAAAKSIDSLLKSVLNTGGFRLKYRITVNPPKRENELEHPDILVEFAGPDSSLLLERGGELMRSFEHLTHKALRLESEDHDRIIFDCNGFKAAREQELTLAAQHAAEKVRKSGAPYQFQPMSPRERRMLHLAIRQFPDLRTESAGEGPNRCVVIYPANYSGKPLQAQASGRPFGRRR